MKINTQHLLFSNARFIKGLSLLLLIYFSSTIMHNSLMLSYQDKADECMELCDFPIMETESSNESESKQKNSFEEFVALQKLEYNLHRVENSFIFYIEVPNLTNQIKDLPTPPPKHFLLAV